MRNAPYSRGVIDIVDLPGLLMNSCKCYDAIKSIADGGRQDSPAQRTACASTQMRARRPSRRRSAVRCAPGDERAPWSWEAISEGADFGVEWDASASTPEGSMSESDSRPDERIERLEERVVELREAIRRSRILAAAGRACALAGAAWLAGLMFGFVTFMPVRFVSGVVVGLGGLILMGSSVGSTRQLELSLRRAESERNAAIDALELVAVQNGERVFGEITKNEA